MSILCWRKLAQLVEDICVSFTVDNEYENVKIQIVRSPIKFKL
jgi:hypothetical protein